MKHRRPARSFLREQPGTPVPPYCLRQQGPTPRTFAGETPRRPASRPLYKLRLFGASYGRHELEHQPGTAAAPENSCTRCSPPLGREPDPLLPGDPAAPGTQVPPQIETPGQTPHPDTNSAPQGVPMTNGTPAACYQKNAREFLAGDVQTSVMAHYAPGLFSTDQHTHSCHPAPEEDASQVLSLVDWREDAPYG